MLDMTMEDATAKYKGTLMMIDGEVKYIQAIKSLSEFSVVDIKTEMDEIIRVNEKNLKAPGRIGFVQVGAAVVYTTRVAARMWKGGITGDNIHTSGVGPRGGQSLTTVSTSVRRLLHPGIAAALANEYPNLKKASRMAKQQSGTFAFDKQFAVDCDDVVYYKTHIVGRVIKGAIDFHDSAVSLNCLLGEQNA